LTEGEKEEKARAKEALHSDGEGSDDEGDTRKAATYGNKKNEVCAVVCACLPLLHRWTWHYFETPYCSCCSRFICVLEAGILSVWPKLIPCHDSYSH